MVRLDIGDPDFDTPAHIVEAAARAAIDGFTHYGPSSGLPSLRAMIAEKVCRLHGVPCLPEPVVVTSGGCGALFLSFLALLDSGDEVLIPDPGWPQYRPMALAVSAVPMRYRLDPSCGFEPDLNHLEERIGTRTRVLVVNPPSNPTGAVFCSSVLEALIDVALRHRLWVVSDECYDELVLDGHHVSAAALGAPDRVVAVFSFSKTYARLRHSTSRASSLWRRSRSSRVPPPSPRRQPKRL